MTANRLDRDLSCWIPIESEVCLSCWGQSWIAHVSAERWVEAELTRESSRNSNTSRNAHGEASAAATRCP